MVDNTLKLALKQLPQMPVIHEDYKSPREILVPLDHSVKEKAKQKINAANGLFQQHFSC
jgi:hypothetical protein